MEQRRRRSRRKSNARKKRMLLIGAIGATLIIAIFLIVYFVMRSAVNKIPEKEIWNNVHIEDVDVSGMTQKEATDTLTKLINEYKAEQVTLVAEEAEAEMSLSELGFAAGNLDKVIKEALAVGKKGSVWSRYKTMKELKEKNIRFELIYAIDSETAENVISEKIPHLENEAKDATIKRENGQFVITEGVTGKKIDLNSSIEVVEEYFNTKWEPGAEATIELVTVLDEPDVTGEQLRTIKDVLGSFSTSFSSGSSRGKNIANAASFINGTVLLPGEVMSASDSMKPRTAENGYLEAGAYLNGETVQSLGGGVCQVSSTLYNAVLLAELEVTERFAHSMIVNYVEPSMDAAIADGYKDLKFKNNTDTPVYIEGYTSGGRVTFTIYGKETRSAGRKVSYVSEVTSKTEAGKKFVASGDAVGTLKKSVSGHTGMKAKLWKVVTENGKEVSREAINSSTYRKSDATWSVGTATDNAEAKKVVTGAISSQDEAKIKAAITQAKGIIEAAKKPATTPSEPAPTTPTTGTPATPTTPTN